MMICELCHQHKVNGPNPATCCVKVPLFNVYRPTCRKCAMKFNRNTGGLILPISSYRENVSDGQ